MRQRDPGLRSESPVEADLDLLRRARQQAATHVCDVAAACEILGADEHCRSVAELLCDGEGSVEGHRKMAEGYPTSAVAVLHYSGRWADLQFGEATLERFHVCRDEA